MFPWSSAGRESCSTRRYLELLDREFVPLETRVLAFTLRALVHAEAGREKEALSALEAARAIRYAMGGPLALAWADRARAQAALGRPVESAADVLDDTLALTGPSDVPWLAGLSAVGRRAWSEAAAAFRAALEAGPMPPHLLWALAELANRTAEPPETAVLLVWARVKGGDRHVDARELEAYAAAHSEGPLASLLR